MKMAKEYNEGKSYLSVQPAAIELSGHEFPNKLSRLPGGDFQLVIHNVAEGSHHRRLELARVRIDRMQLLDILLP